MVKVCLVLKEIVKLCSSLAVPFYMPTNNEHWRVPCVPYLCQHLVVSMFQILAIQLGMQWEFISFPLRKARRTLYMLFQTHWTLFSLGRLFTNIVGLACAYIPWPQVASSICYF